MEWPAPELERRLAQEDAPLGDWSGHVRRRAPANGRKELNVQRYSLAGRGTHGP